MYFQLKIGVKNMAYCTKCGIKNEDDAEFCKKCGASLKGFTHKTDKDDDCVCSGSKQNPFVPVFWEIVIILIGLWIMFTFIIQGFLPVEYKDISFGTLIVIIIAIAIILTGFRIITKNR